jgi:hypothetical protein
MKRLVMLFVGVMTSAVLAQGKDLGGSWVLDAEKSGGARGPAAITLTVSEKEFVVKAGAEETHFKLDGTASDLGHGGRGKAAWKGDKMEVTIMMEKGDQTLTFAREGAWLVQEGTNARGAVKVYFKKAPAKQ